MSKKFQRTIENFTCEHCGEKVAGNGYTNHCPKCLWSKHVDVNPGDREEKCGGMMEPAVIEKKGKVHTILHSCSVCGFSRKNLLSRNDDFDIFISLAGKNQFLNRSSKKFINLPEQIDM